MLNQCQVLLGYILQEVDDTEFSWKSQYPFSPPFYLKVKWAWRLILGPGKRSLPNNLELSPVSSPLIDSSAPNWGNVLLSLIRIHRHHLYKQTDTHRQVASSGWQVDSETVSLVPRRGPSAVIFRTRTHARTLQQLLCNTTAALKTSVPSDVTFLSLLIGATAPVITDFYVSQGKSNYSYSNPMLCRSELNEAAFSDFSNRSVLQTWVFCPTATVISALSLLLAAP